MKATIFLQYEKQRYVHAVICFLFVKFLPKVVLANALEKAGTGAFSDSGADLIPEILKFELKLTLKLTLRLISRSRTKSLTFWKARACLLLKLLLLEPALLSTCFLARASRRHRWRGES